MRGTWFLYLLVYSIGLVFSLRAQDTATATEAAPNVSGVGKGTASFVAKEIWISSPNAFPNGLDALEVYAEEPGRHPLALLTHGTSEKEEDRRQVTPWAQLGQALWFARRGYTVLVVVRRGYGHSGGKQDGAYSACGARGDTFETIGETSADDLRSAVKFAASLPQVDSNIVVSAGVSTGGFAQVALVADPPAGLRAAISFAGGRGGDGHEHNCNLSQLVSAFYAFGRKAKKHGGTPMLWIYSQNDHWFTPGMAHQFDAEYTKAGGADQFVLAPSDGEDGHHLYYHIPAWSDIVAAFLKAHDLLPLGDKVLPAPEPPNTPPPGQLREQGLEAWRRYLLGGPFKAFAMTRGGKWGLAQGMFDQSLADREAMDRCRRAAGTNEPCSIVARTSKGK